MGVWKQFIAGDGKKHGMWDFGDGRDEKAGICIVFPLMHKR